MTTSQIRDFYTRSVLQEWRRLVKDPYHRLEFDTTLHFLKKRLPEKGYILDAGGGPGRYTLALAKLGYDISLLDLAPANLDFARRRIRRAGVARRVRSVEEGTIVDLSRFPDETFDAVVCTGGPLSHVLDAGDRERAVSELARVAKPGAPVFVSVMSRLSVLALILDISQEELEMPHFQALRDTGDYCGERGFTACHFFLPEELLAAFSRPEVTLLAMAGLEGLAANHRKAFNQVAKNPTRLQSWLETHFQTCTHPAVIATSEHMLVVCRKN